MQPTVLFGSAAVVGVLVASKMGLKAFMNYSWLVGIGFIIYKFVSRKVPEYPAKEIYEMFKANPLHGGKADGVGLIVIVTGSTSGIGQKVAEELFRYGATVIIASRNAAKGAAVIEEIRAANPGSKGNLVFGKLDTADLDSVRDFANWVKQNYPRVDYLVNNAGMQYAAMEGSPMMNMSVNIVSKQGYDISFVTNYLGHFLLTHLLLPNVKGRIVNVASSFHFQTDGSSLDPRKGGDPRGPKAAFGDNKSFFHRSQAYGASKLANVLHAVELQRRMKDYGYPDLKIVSLCPGWVRTNILGHGDPIAYLIHLNAFNLQEGILSTMAALFDKDLPGGGYVSNHIMPLSTYPWWEDLLRKLTEKGVREQVLLILGIAVLVCQSQSYGHHLHRTSPEARDPQLAAAFYDWTFAELQRKGYIPQ